MMRIRIALEVHYAMVIKKNIVAYGGILIYSNFCCGYGIMNATSGCNDNTARVLQVFKPSILIFKK